jgi:thiamine-monophosphate kinase
LTGWRGYAPGIASRAGYAGAAHELSIIDRYFRPLAGKAPLLEDAGPIAVPRGEELVITTDMLASDVHFLAGDPPDGAAIARRASGESLRPCSQRRYAACLCPEPRPYAGSRRRVVGWLRGGAAADQRYRVTLLGGDTIAVPSGRSSPSPHSGTQRRGAWCNRAGGRPGDDLMVWGTIGGAAAGLALQGATAMVGAC